ncbi:MAG TPA: hypothetical protein VGI20_13855 [Rhizomicrobium sp.]|jgi:hypothetical protein
MAEILSTSLSPQERARRYRDFACETLRLAEAAEKPELKATYISLSVCWRNLAREAEQIGRIDTDKLRQN